MKVISVRNVHRALPEGVRHLALEGIRMDTRNGPVLRSPEPVVTRYDRPWERVVFWPERDANPFFHYLETIWMLAGANRLDYLTLFNKNMASYSDDGHTTHAGYGHRLIMHWKFDQIATALHCLHTNPSDRRVLMQIWDPMVDMDEDKKDIPCNFAIDLKIVQGKLQFIVHCRSNDMIWGAYGANAVHMSMIHQVIAELLGVEIGPYFQISDDFHGYRKTLDPLFFLADEVEDGMSTRSCFYSGTDYQRSKLLQDTDGTLPVRRWELLQNRCARFVNSVAKYQEEAGQILWESQQLTGHWTDPMLRDADLMVRGWCRYREWVRKRRDGDYSATYLEMAKNVVRSIEDPQWSLACLQWLERRDRNWQRAKDDGVFHEQ